MVKWIRGVFGVEQLALVMYGVMVGVVFWGVLKAGMFYSSDYLAGYPMSEWARSEFPRFVRWNPYIFGGVRMMPANMYNLFYVIGMPAVWVMAIHVYLACVGMWVYLGRGWGAFFSGVAYGFTGNMVSLVLAGHDGKMMVMAYLPWVLWLLDRISWKNFWVLGLVGWLSLSTGHVQMSYYLFVFCGVYFAFRKDLWCHWRKVLLAVGIAVILWLPQYVETQLVVWGSTRGEGSYERAVTFSMPPEEMLCTIDPGFKGGIGEYVGRREMKMHTEYMGILAVLFFVWGLFLKPRKEIIALGVVSLIISFGGYTPLYHLIYMIKPNGAFRSPAMAFYGFVFAACVIGWKVAEKARVGAILWAFVLWANLWMVTYKYIIPITFDQAYGNVRDVAEFIQRDKGDFRIFTMDEEIADNRFMLWRIKSLNGYYPFPRKEFVDSVGGNILPDFSKMTVGLAKQYGVKYVISHHKQPFRMVFKGKEFDVYEI